MKMLRLTIMAVAAIALLRILTYILDKTSPSSAVFHRQFLFSLQLLVVLWFVVSLLLIIFKVSKSWVAGFLPILIVMLVLGSTYFTVSGWKTHEKSPVF